MKLNAKQQALINKRLGAEPRRRHEPGSLSVCPDELKPDTFTFSILLTPSPQRDGRCTAFAQIGPGASVLRAITKSPATEPQSVTKTELFTVDSGTVRAGMM
jgi:cyclophilin family peptidyl-prolyl cis-trans isomerase